MQDSIISIDSGSSFFKLYDGSRLKVFPAATERLAASSPTHREEIAVDGVRYAVGWTGLHAKRDQQKDPHIERGFHGGLTQRVQICFALERGGHRRTLVRSLPYSDYQDRSVRDLVKQQTRFEWQAEVDGPTMAVTFDEVLCCPQGAGALVYWRQVEASRRQPASALLVDVGSCTSDICAVYWDDSKEDWAYNHDASRSYRTVSVSTFKRAWAEGIRQLDGLQGRQLGYHELMKVAMSGDLTLVHLGAPVDVSGPYQRAVEAFTCELRDAVRVTTGALWESFEQVILTGGGAKLVDLELWGDQRVRVLPTEANVIGQYIAAGGVLTDRSVLRGAA